MRTGLSIVLLALACCASAAELDGSLDATYRGTVRAATAAELARLTAEIKAYPKTLRDYRRQHGIRDVRRADPAHKQAMAGMKKQLAENKKLLAAIRRGETIVPALNIRDLKVGQVGRLPDDEREITYWSRNARETATTYHVAKILRTVDLKGEAVLYCTLQKVRAYTVKGVQYRIEEGEPSGRFIITGIGVDSVGALRPNDGKSLGHFFRLQDKTFHVSGTHKVKSKTVFVLTLYEPDAD